MCHCNALNRTSLRCTGTLRPSRVFSSSARYEIEWKGRKLAGSAQRRYACAAGEIVLQHGSILCGSAHRRLADYLALDDELVRRDICAGLNEKTSDLEMISGQQVDIQELSRCMKKGFEHAWGITFVETDHKSGYPKEAYA